MNMRISLACVAALVAAGAYAEATDDVAAAAAAVKERQRDDTRWYFTLPLCRRVDGSGEVLKHGETEWQPVEEGRFYPLGSAFRASTANSTVVIAFGKECMVTVENGSGFASCAQKLGEKSRRIVLTGGEVLVSLPNNLKDGLFSVEAVRCLGCCGLAPVAVVNGEVHGKLETKDVKEIIEKYRKLG